MLSLGTRPRPLKLPPALRPLSILVKVVEAVEAVVGIIAREFRELAAPLARVLGVAFNVMWSAQMFAIFVVVRET